MPNEIRAEKIASYGSAPELLEDAIQKYPREMWQYRPQDGWSIHEILIHLADSEANSYIRCRRFIAEPGKSLMAYDENQWAQALDYHARDPDQAVALFRWLRQVSYDLIRNVPEDAWGQRAYHPEDGDMSLDDWLDIYARHVPDHIAQMERVYQMWQAQS